MDSLSKLTNKDLIKGLPKLEKDQICDACQLRKQTKNSFKSKGMVSISRPLELLHIDLFGPIRITSLRGKKYGIVIVDDFLRFTWIIFLAQKDEAFKTFTKFYQKISNEKNTSIVCIHSDHDTEFKN